MELKRGLKESKSGINTTTSNDEVKSCQNHAIDIKNTRQKRPKPVFSVRTRAACECWLFGLEKVFLRTSVLPSLKIEFAGGSLGVHDLQRRDRQRGCWNQRED